MDDILPLILFYIVIIIILLIGYLDQIIIFFSKIFYSEDEIFSDRFILYRRNDGLLGIRDSKNPDKIFIGRNIQSSSPIML